MELGLSKEHVLFKKMITAFTATHVKPFAKEIDDEERFPLDAVAQMAQAGILGIPFPSKYGGEDGDYFGYILAVETLATACATTSIVLSAHTSLCCTPIFEFGTEEQKQRFLVPLCKGQKLGAFALTEPNAGTDAAAQETIAVRVGDEFILNGSKIFITNAGYADVYIIFAMTDKSLGTKGGISAFIVESTTPGFRVGKKEHKMGIRGSSTCELIFENCRIPANQLLGKLGDGFKIAMRTLDGGRIGVAAQALGIAQGALNETIAYTKQRKQFGKSIASFQNTQFQIATMATKVEAARLLVYKAVHAKVNNKTFALEAAMAKLYASEVAMEVTTQAVQLHGGYGYTRDYPVERMMRDAKITEIYEGTSEVQRMVISSSLLK